MLYKNIVTNTVIKSNHKIKGKNWIEIKDNKKNNPKQNKKNNEKIEEAATEPNDEK